MSTASRSGSRDFLTAALLDVRHCAADGGDALLHHVPDTGDLPTGRVVDDFVERASDALRVLAESLGEVIGTLDPQSPGSSAAADEGRGSRR